MSQQSQTRPAGRAGVAATTLLALGLSLFAAGAGGAEVFINRNGTELLDPAFVTSTGAEHNAEVDLQNGTVKALVSVAVPAGFPIIGHSLTAGINDVYLVNAGASPIVASSGFLTLALDGAFSFVTAGSGGREANVYVNALLEAMLVPAQGGSTQFYSAGIGTTHGWNDWQGFHSDFTEIAEDGGTVTVMQNNVSGLRADLAMPAITLNPNDTLRISLSLFTGINASNGLAATNDFFNTARLSLVLPPDAIVTSNTAVPLDWVSAEVPAPPAAWLLATGLAGIAGACRRRRAGR